MDSKPISRGAPSSITVNRDPKINSKEEKSSKVDSNRSEIHGKNWSVKISPESKSMLEARNKALEIAKNAPDVRQEKIDAIKQRISNGEYKVDAGKIADGMLKEAIKDHLANDPGLILDEM